MEKSEILFHDNYKKDHPFTMSVKGLIYFEQHFLFSNRLVQLLMGLRPYQSSNDQLLQICIVTVYLLPIIVQQSYHFYVSIDTSLHSAIKILQNIIAAMCFLCTYCTTYYRFITMKLMYSYFKCTYESISDEDELNIFENYTRQTKMYTYFFTGITNLCVIANIFPSILSIFIYHFGTIDNALVTLPLPVNNVSNPGPLYYSLLLYQIIGIYISINITNVWNSLYLTLIQNACCQFTAIGLKLRQPFLNNKICNNGQDENNINSWKEFDWIVDIIKRYIRVTEFVDLISYFTKINYLLCSFFVMILIILDFVNIFQLTSMSQKTGEIIECCAYVVTSIFIAYINFYMGQKIINHSNIAYDELCQVPFYMLSIKTQKMLLFMIVRSKMECALSIGGFFIASHQVFSELIQKAFSFATVYYTLF